MTLWRTLRRLVPALSVGWPALRRVLLGCLVMGPLTAPEAAAVGCECGHCVGAGCGVALAGSLTASSGTGGPFLIGLDFISEPRASDGSFIFGFEPFALANPTNNFSTQGAFAGRTEAEVQRRITLAVEDAFRQSPTSESGTTLAIQIFQGRVPEHLAGRRLNVVLGQSSSEVWTLLGESFTGAFDTGLPDDSDVAAVYLDAIDQLGLFHVNYDTFESAINAIAGTTAHEIGHLFDAEHVTVAPGDPLPYPIMAIESTGLPTSARLTQRQFSTTSPADQPIAELLSENAGVALRGDFNMDGSVNGIDVGILIANFGRLDALMQEGDANGDHRVDGLDVGTVVSQWTSAGSLMPLSGVRLAASPLPEPATWSSLLTVVTLMMRCQRSWRAQRA
jgi:hypothetical protein